MFSLKLENENGNVVDINDNERYVVLSAPGLNASSASIFMAKSPNKKGGKYNGSTLNERTLILNIKILGDVEENRNALYEWTESEQYCKIHYKNGVKTVYCEGYVQECDADPFTDNEIMTVAILCADPYWRSLSEISVEIAMVTGGFTFPFSIDSAGVPFSSLTGRGEANIFNAGAETGIKIRIQCNGEVTNFAIYDMDNTARIFRINTTLSAGWFVEINTEGSPKTCKAIKPDGTTENLMKYIGGNPTWFTLKKGNNRFGYTADAGMAEVSMSVSFSNKYLGV